MEKKLELLIIKHCALIQAETEKTEHHLSNYMVWGRSNNDHLFEPYLSDGSVSHLNYSSMLKNLFVPQLQIYGLRAIFGCNKIEPAHFAIPV